MSIFLTRAERYPSFSSLAATLLKWLTIGRSLIMSMPVSYGVPFKVATKGSVAGFDVPFPSGERAQSTMSAPACIAIRFIMSPVPVVLCVCRCTFVSGLSSSFIFFTTSYAVKGSSRFAISFMQILSAPISSKVFANFTKYSVVCTGLVV